MGWMQIAFALLQIAMKYVPQTVREEVLPKFRQYMELARDEKREPAPAELAILRTESHGERIDWDQGR